MAEGGIQRLVWMPKMLKEEIMDRLKETLPRRSASPTSRI